MGNLLRVVILIFLSPLFANAQDISKDEAARTKFEKKKIHISKEKLEVELAKSNLQLEVGLMYRESLKDGKGMLFVFREPEVLNFWMKNTLIPLSVGFFDSNRKLLKIVDMDPASPMDNFPKTYSSEKPASYALEVPQGWFKKKKIKAGEKFSFEDSK